MEPIQATRSVPETAYEPPGANPSLVSLAARFAGGDFASECLLLFGENQAARLRIDLQGVRVQHQAVREARRKKMDLMRKRIEAARKSGFWSKVGKLFTVVAGVLTAMATLAGCPVAVVGLVGLVGGAMASGPGLAGAAFARKAGQASAGALAQDHAAREAGQLQAGFMSSLENAVEVEQKMIARIQRLVESENQNRILGRGGTP